MSKDADWIEWDGGPMPVPGSCDVEIKLQHLDGEIRYRDGYDTAGWFDSIGWWTGEETKWRISAYRVVHQS